MKAQQRQLQSLVDQTRSNDADAGRRLQNRLLPGLRMMVRRFLITGAAPDGYRRAFARACAKFDANPDRDRNERLAPAQLDGIARRISEELVQTLRTRAAAQRETVCA